MFRPRGDAPGFVTVLDDKTLAIPERLGNNRVDTFECLLEDPRVGLLFMIPGNGDTLRMSGRAKIVQDAVLQGKLAVKGRPPALVLVVNVEEAFLHCAKSIARSRLWQPEFWPPLDDVPSLAQAMVAHGKLSSSLADVQDIIDNDAQHRLY
ncbi:pyridoxamine 5'-phosphate oxidase family protein [Roseibium salinum]|nr:pyridoxamine 5'-phosphate oxidase family protein [Roseibium salinum]